jgi:pilus assembly protein CpaB
MRSSRSLLMILASVALAIAAVIVAWRWVDSKTKVDTNMVVVAARDLDLGTRLTPEMIQLVQWPKESMPQGAFQSRDALLKDSKTGEPRVIRASLQRGEPILESRLAPVGTKGGLSAVIAAGHRAITVRVNDVVGVAGFALPGSYVDILVNTTSEGTSRSNSDKSISKIVLEHILVLAIAQEVGRDETKPKVVNAVTLEVTPEQAEQLDLARSVGSLSLVLRNQIDPAPVTTTGATKSSLLRGSAGETPPPPKVEVVEAPAPRPRRAAKAAPTPPPAQNCVDVITGVHSSRECF